MHLLVPNRSRQYSRRRPSGACSKWHGQERQRGASLVEMSLTLVILLTVTFGTMELCMMAYTKTVLGDAANEGVRYAIVHSSDTTGSGAQAVALRYARLSFHSITTSNITVSFPDGNSRPPHRVRVTISYPFVPYLSAFVPSLPTLTAYAEGRVFN